MSAQEIYKIIIEHRVSNYTNWDTNNIILRLGEFGIIKNPANIPEGANTTLAMVVGDGSNTFSTIYSTSEFHPNVFYSGIGAGYVLPKGRVAYTQEGEVFEGVLGGLIPNSSYFQNNTTGTLTPLYYTIGGPITQQGVTYDHQWTFDASTYVNITGAHITDLITETQTQTTSELFNVHTSDSPSSAPLANDHLEGIALYNYREKTEEETSRPYAVFGIDNTGMLCYTTDYRGSISGSDIKRLLYYNASSSTGLLKFSGTDVEGYTPGTLTIQGLGDDDVVYDPYTTTSHTISIPTNYCLTVSNNGENASVDDNNNINLGDVACQSIALFQDGEYKESFDVEDGIIRLDLSLYTAEDAIKLLQISQDLWYRTIVPEEPGNTHLQRIDNIESSISTLQGATITSISLDGTSYTPSNHSFILYSKTAIQSDANNTIGVSYDTENHIYTLTHPNVTSAYDPKPTNSVVTELIMDQRGHVTTMHYTSLGALAFKDVPVLDPDAPIGNYYLRARKTSSGISYEWVAE